MRPEGALGDSRTRVLLAVVDGCRTYAELIERTGLKRNTLWHRLHELRDEGLVTWVDGQHGTLRPLVEEAFVRPFDCAKMGPSDESGGGAVDAAPRLPNAPRRR